MHITLDQLSEAREQCTKLEIALESAEKHAAAWKALAKVRRSREASFLTQIERNEKQIAERNATVGTLKDHAWETEHQRQIVARDTKQLVARMLATEIRLACTRLHVEACGQCGDCDEIEKKLEKPLETPKIDHMPDCLSVVYYDCRGDEVLTHEEQDAAVADLVEVNFDKEKTAEQTVADLCPIEVSAYSREAIPSGWVQERVDDILERLDENMADNWGDPDGDHKSWDEAELAVIRDRLEHAMRAARQTATVWRCKVVSTQTFEAEAVLEMLHESGYL